MTETVRQTPLTPAHEALGARMVEFAGWSMPVMYTSILDEARSVRRDAGMFDISHMGRTRVHGSGAAALLQRLTSNDVDALAPGSAHYSLLTNDAGGVIDDIIVYCIGPDDFMVVINASNTDKDLARMRSHASATVSVDDNTVATAMIAVQGPTAVDRVASMADLPQLRTLGRFQFADTTYAGGPATFCRTGYTGEDGLEIIVPAATANQLWSALHTAGVAACGLGARDALRIEAGYPLYGHEIDDTTNPVEAGLMWVVKLDKGPFAGRDVIARVKEDGAARKLVGLTLADRQAPRQGYTVHSGAAAVGTVTSGVFSPTLEHAIAMAYVAADSARSGTVLEVDVRGRMLPCTVVPKKNLLDRPS